MASRRRVRGLRRCASLGSIVSVSRESHPRCSTPPGATATPPRATLPPSPRVSIVSPRRIRPRRDPTRPSAPNLLLCRRRGRRGRRPRAREQRRRTPAGRARDVEVREARDGVREWPSRFRPSRVRISPTRTARRCTSRRRPRSVGCDGLDARGEPIDEPRRRDAGEMRGTSTRRRRRRRVRKRRIGRVRRRRPRAEPRSTPPRLEPSSAGFPSSRSEARRRARLVARAPSR